MSALRTIVVDDDESVRTLLSTVLPLSESDVHIVGQASNGSEALERAEELRPDLIILDHMMPVRSGASVVPDLRRRLPLCEIVLFTAYSDAPEIGEMLRRLGEQYHLEIVPKGSMSRLEEVVTVIVERHRE